MVTPTDVGRIQLAIHVTPGTSRSIFKSNHRDTCPFLENIHIHSWTSCTYEIEYALVYSWKNIPVPSAPQNGCNNLFTNTNPTKNLWDTVDMSSTNATKLCDDVHT